MRLFKEQFLMNKMEDFVRMASSSNERFCSLDMLAEVASATLQSDPSLIPNSSVQRAKTLKIGSSFSRKSVSNCEKLTLDQIRSLSEKNLIEMFSEHIFDEMKKNYSFQCFLIPDKCSQTFKSFGNETRARYKMKAHLLSHIKDLVASANAINNHEEFLAEPLHVRKKRLTEFNQKSTRKKKKKKHNKMKKETNLELPTKSIEEFNSLKDKHHEAIMEDSSFSPKSEINYDHSNADIKNCVSENVNNTCSNQSASTLMYLPYFPSLCKPGADQVILKGLSSSSDFNTTFPKSRVKRKRSKPQSDTKISRTFERDAFLKCNSDYAENNSHLNCDAQSESEVCLPIHHDHTYTSFNGKTLNCDSSSTSESGRSVKIICDPFHSMQTTHHQCKKRESPLIIPTPPFPYVYIPLLPHIALIQEVGSSTNCKCTSHYITEGLQEYSISPKHMPLHLPKDNEHSKNSHNLCQSVTEDHMDPEEGENMLSHAYTEEASEDATSSEGIKLFPNSSFCIDDMRPECPENLRALEKV